MTATHTWCRGVIEVAGLHTALCILDHGHEPPHRALTTGNAMTAVGLASLPSGRPAHEPVEVTIEWESPTEAGDAGTGFLTPDLIGGMLRTLLTIAPVLPPGRVTEGVARVIELVELVEDEL